MRRRRDPSDRTIGVALAVLTVAVRLPLLVRADLVTYDGTYYINQAKALLHASLSGGAFPIGYPLLIAPLLAVVRDGVLAGALVSLVAAMGSVAVFERLCRRHVRRSLALLAAIVFATTPLFMRVSVLTFSESAYTFWVLLALALFDQRPARAGAAIGMAAATRPEAVAIAGALSAVAAARWLRARTVARPRSLFAFALAFVLVYGAGVAVMSAAQGRVTLLSRAGAFKSVATPWQLREGSVDYAGKDSLEAALARERPGFDRRESYVEVLREEIVGLSQHLMIVVPALAVAGAVVYRGAVATALLPLLFIPFFTEARGQTRWLVPYLAPLVFYAILVIEKMRSDRLRTAVAAVVAALAAVSLYANRSVYSTGVESEYASTRDVARRFAPRVQPGDAVAGRKPYFAFYAGARYVDIPAAPYDDTIAFVEKNARYLALEERTVDRLRPILRPLVYDAAAVRGELRYRQIVVEPTGEFVYERTGATDSLSMRRLTTPAIGDLTPSWSPDGSRVAFRRFVEDGGAAVCVVDKDGGNLRKLARTTRERDAIAWSPDGARVVFTGLIDGNFELTSLDVRTGQTTRVVSSASHEWSPSFARATGAFLFCSDRDGTPATWMLARGAREPRRVSLANGVADLASASPAGTRAAWVDLEGRLIFWDLATREGIGVFEPRGVISPASWSPDASMAVIEAFDWNSARLYLVDTSNGHALMLTRSRTGDGMPSWSPDGSEIVAVTARGGPPSIWVYGNLEPFIKALRADYDVRVLQRPAQLRTPPPAGLRRVLPEETK